MFEHTTLEPVICSMKELFLGIRNPSVTRHFASPVMKSKIFSLIFVNDPSIFRYLIAANEWRIIALNTVDTDLNYRVRTDELLCKKRMRSSLF